ncbi:MAG: putative methyltransferase [Candidatus Brocadia fulgida]|uniref:Methyltransferase n=1 Tax=Candidatus Brocadia fulgida TaxID=380242 RepID=A0A0M2UUA9_9BACT|nr:MAG: putative methyltransferase [Candidatus Brocadia fulgida]
MKTDTLRETIYAFNNSDTVASYDADMDIWHPNRVKMASIVCEILPFDRTERVRFLDLGAGTGYLSHKLTETFPHATIIAVDAAALMIEKAKVRLHNHLERVTFHVSPFQELPKKLGTLAPVDAVVSSLALHHLYREEKLTLIRYVHSLLRPHGWFVNCDVFKTSDAVLEARFRRLHHQGYRRERVRSGTRRSPWMKFPQPCLIKRKKMATTCCSSWTTFRLLQRPDSARLNVSGRNTGKRYMAE